MEKYIKPEIEIFAIQSLSLLNKSSADAEAEVADIVDVTDI